MDIKKLKATIIQSQKDGVDFECECYYCGADPFGLVERGDAIPILYSRGDDTYYCFRCGDEASYSMISKYIKDPAKGKECLKNFKRTRKELL